MVKKIIGGVITAVVAAKLIAYLGINERAAPYAASSRELSSVEAAVNGSGSNSLRAPSNGTHVQVNSNRQLRQPEALVLPQASSPLPEPAAVVAGTLNEAPPASTAAVVATEANLQAAMPAVVPPAQPSASSTLPIQTPVANPVPANAFSAPGAAAMPQPPMPIYSTPNYSTPITSFGLRMAPGRPFQAAQAGPAYNPNRLYQRSSQALLPGRMPYRQITAPPRSTPMRTGVARPVASTVAPAMRRVH